MLTAAQFRRLKRSAADLLKQCNCELGPYYHSQNCPYYPDSCPRLLSYDISKFLQNLPEGVLEG